MVSKAILTVVGCLAAIGAGLVIPNRKSAPVPAVSSVSSRAIRAIDERGGADKLFASADYERAKVALISFIEANEADPDKDVQDVVGHARIKLGYVVAKTDGPAAARDEFVKAAEKYQGTGKMGADFGGIPDQGAYQAAATFMVEDNEEAARQAFKEFIKDYPLSPLVHGAWKRLGQMRGGQTTPEEDALLHQAVSKREAHIKFEMSVCGPKCIEFLLPRLGLRPLTYKEIASDAGTNETGTTLAGMQRALDQYGVKASGYQLNRADLGKLKCPAIVLKQNHFLVALEALGDAITIYDTTTKETSSMKLPPLTDTQFSLPVLVIESIHRK